MRKKEVNQLNKCKKSVLKEYKKKLKESKKFKKRDLQFLSFRRALDIINGPKKYEEERDTKLEDIEQKIYSISKITLTLSI